MKVECWGENADGRLNTTIGFAANELGVVSAFYWEMGDTHALACEAVSDNVGIAAEDDTRTEERAHT